MPSSCSWRAALHRRAHGEPAVEMLGDALRCPAIPALGRVTLLAARPEDVVDACADPRSIASDERVRPLADRDRALCVLTHCQARDRQRCRLFLDAAGIS